MVDPEIENLIPRLQSLVVKVRSCSEVFIPVLLQLSLTQSLTKLFFLLIAERFLYRFP